MARKHGALLLLASAQMQAALASDTFPDHFGGIGELPTSAWPAATGAESNAAWPSGAQPSRLRAWPTNTRTNDGHEHPANCWKTKPIHDTHADGWPGRCRSLKKEETLTTEAECEQFCRGDARCPVWQFVKDGDVSECWLGFGVHCDEAETSSSPDIIRAQRLLHGDVHVLKTFTGQKVLNLYGIGGGLEMGADQETRINRCQAWCYSDIGCEYWQFSDATGCEVDWPIMSTVHGTDPSKQVQYPLTTSGTVADASFVKGEYIQHYCPAQVGADPATSAPGASQDATAPAQDSDWSFWALAALIALLVILGCLYVFMMQGQDEKKPKKTRGIKPQAEYSYDFQDEPAEQGKPLMMSGRSQAPQQVAPQSSSWFNAIDANGDGQITRAEWEAAMQQRQAQVPRPVYQAGQVVTTPTHQQHLSMPPPTQLVDFGGQPGYYQYQTPYLAQSTGGVRYAGSVPGTFRVDGTPQLMSQGMPLPMPPTTQQLRMA